MVFLLVIFIVPFPLTLVKRSWAIFISRLGLAGILYSSHIIFGIKAKIEGEEHIPKEPFILAAKHLSMWETIFFAVYFNMPVYIFKRELLQIPVFGWYMATSGMVGIKRSGGSKTIIQIANAATNVLKKQKRILAIFPQGTRVPIDESYSLEKYPYKKGIIGICSKIPEVPVLPVAHNAVKAFGRNFLSPKKGGVITVKFLPPVQMLNKTGVEFLKEIQETIETETKKLL